MWIVPQVTIYMDEETVERAKAAAATAKVSLSKWISSLVRQKTEQQWPDSVKSLAGAWKDFPSAEELRDEQGVDSERDAL